MDTSANPQYDKDFVGITNKKFLWWAWVFWGGFGVVSLREFAKRKRANSWQSKGKFAFKFVDYHAVFAKTARKGKFKMISVRTNSLIHFTMQTNSLINFTMQANLLINFIIKAFEAFVKEKILAGVKADDFFAAFGLIRA